MLKELPSKVEVNGTMQNTILVLRDKCPLPSRDPSLEFKMFYADEWLIVGDAMDNPEGGSFGTQTGTVYQTVDAKFGWPVQIKASDVVLLCGLPESLQSGDGPSMFNLSFVESTE